MRGDGVDLAVHTRGAPERPTVVLLHGYPDTHAVWNPVAELLAERFHVVTYDVRGAGSSARPAGVAAYRFEHLMNDLRAVLDAVGGTEPVHLVGHDWGSLQGWRAVTEMPDRFASYTSISGPYPGHLLPWARAQVKTPAGAVRVLRQLAHSWYIGAFQLPVLPELLWRSGIVERGLRRADRKQQRRAAARTAPATDGVGGITESGAGHRFADTVRQDGLCGVNLYRANMMTRRRPGGAGRTRPTSVPVQLIVPVRDPFVTRSLAEDAPRPFATDLTVRRIDSSHWAPALSPEPVARLIEEHVARTQQH